MSLCSWVRGQRARSGDFATLAPVPSNTKVQEILVKIQDKLPTFKGSKNWIGSVEVTWSCSAPARLQTYVMLLLLFELLFFLVFI